MLRSTHDRIAFKLREDIRDLNAKLTAHKEDRVHSINRMRELTEKLNTTIIERNEAREHVNANAEVAMDAERRLKIAQRRLEEEAFSAAVAHIATESANRVISGQERTINRLRLKARDVEVVHQRRLKAQAEADKLKEALAEVVAERDSAITALRARMDAEESAAHKALSEAVLRGESWAIIYTLENKL